MSMGAPKPGSTLPTQGGKGGGIPTQPGQGQLAPIGMGGVQPQTLQPGAQIFNGTVTPNTIGPNGLPVGGTMPAGYNGPIPPQGGKFPGNPQQPTTSNIPGYAQPYVNALNPQVQQPAMVDPAMVAQVQAAYGQPGQVPAQGGKAPLTPEQRAAISNNADPARGLGLNLGSMLYGGGGQQPTAPVTTTRAPITTTRAPVMPRPVMPRPTMTRPSLIGSGLAGLRDRRGRR
jgi:hypothetical protein